MRNTLKLIRLRPGAVLPTRATAGSFGYDLAVPEDFDAFGVPAGQTVILPTGWRLGDNLPLVESAVMVPGEHGLKAEVVGGVSMMILPRSSLPLKHGLIVGNSPGLIDSDYTGEIGVILHNVGKENIMLHGGQRIAQFILVFVDFFPLEEVEIAEQTAERAGFGSTG